MWRVEFQITTAGRSSIMHKDFALTTDAIDFYDAVKALDLKPIVFSIESTCMSREEMVKFLEESRKS